VDDKPIPSAADVVLAVPEIRDYHAINAAIIRHLDAGCGTIRLAGVNGQRLLAAGLAGTWSGVIEVDGDAGPELAAGLDAPGLVVFCRGRAADGAASRMRAGRVLVLGDAGTAFGYGMAGGLAVAAGNAGPRVGLRQAGGDLVVLGETGSLAGECQSGGRLFAFRDRNGPHAGHGRGGGRFVLVDRDGPTDRGREADETDRVELIGLLEGFRPWLGPVA
jgi:glutamate synthase domain-containing protein 3